MTLWILWWIAGSCLVALGALALERAAASVKLPRRGVWLFAIAIVATGPFIISVARILPFSVQTAPPPSVEPTPAALNLPLPVAAAPQPTAQSPAPAPVVAQAAPPPASPSFVMRAQGYLAAADPWVAGFWLIASFAFALAFVRAVFRTRAARARWTDGEVDACPVLIAEDAGPAVVGIVRPRVVLPRWALEFEPAVRTLLLSHEREHIRAGDPRVLFAAISPIVLFPWNAALWWMVRRLRLVIEIDCDARVIRAVGGARDYAQMLLAVGEHRARPLPLATALVDTPTALEQRIDAMTAEPPRRPIVTSLRYAVVAIIIATAIAAAPRPTPLDAMSTPAALWGRIARQSSVAAVVQSLQQSAFRYDQQLGVANFKAGGAGCLAIANASLAPGERLALAMTGAALGDAQVSEAQIIAKADTACDNKMGMGSDVKLTFYQVQRTNDTTAATAVFAVVDPVSPLSIRFGHPVGDLDGDGALEVFRHCPSVEGLHLTVWTGAMLEGRLRWHRYFYVGYDMVPSCTDREVMEPGQVPVAAAPTPGRIAPEERDILEMAEEHSLNMRVDGKPARYGDPELAAAVDHLADVPRPWTVPQMIRLFNQTSSEWLRKLEETRAAKREQMWPEWQQELQRRTDIARLLAASRDPRAAATLGRTLDDTARTPSPPGRELTFGPPLGGEFPNAVRIFGAIFDYFVADFNYGLPPEQWQGGRAGQLYELQVPPVRRWWAGSRARILSVAGPPPSSDLSLSISTDRSEYRLGESILVSYRLTNVSARPIYVPRGAGACPATPPHLLTWFETTSGKQFGPGYGFSCSSGTESLSRTSPTILERMARDAVRLSPGEHLDDTLRLGTMWASGLASSTYLIGAVFTSWGDNDFTARERDTLATLPGAFVQGEAPASARIILQTGASASPTNLLEIFDPYEIDAAAAARIWPGDARSRDSAVLYRTSNTTLHAQLFSRYTIDRLINPYYVRGDFDGDGRMDLAITVRDAVSGRSGVALIRAAMDSVVIYGAGRGYPDANPGNIVHQLIVASTATAADLMVRFNDGPPFRVRWSGGRFAAATGMAPGAAPPESPWGTDPEPSLLVLARQRGLMPAKDSIEVIRRWNPFYVTGDFDGDRTMDVACLVRFPKSDKHAVLILHGTLDSLRFVFDTPGYSLLRPVPKGRTVKPFPLDGLSADALRPQVLVTDAIEVGYRGPFAAMLVWRGGKYVSITTSD